MSEIQTLYNVLKIANLLEGEKGMNAGRAQLIVNNLKTALGPIQYTQCPELRQFVVDKLDRLVPTEEKPKAPSTRPTNRKPNEQQQQQPKQPVQATNRSTAKGRTTSTKASSRSA